MSLETDNPEKGKLLMQSNFHREQIEEDMKFISERTEKIITNAIIIGGALALTYFVISSLSGGSEKKKTKSKKIRLVERSGEDDAEPQFEKEPEAPGILAQVGGVIAAQATGLLLSIAREKLAEYLKTIGQKESTDGHS